LLVHLAILAVTLLGLGLSFTAPHITAAMTLNYFFNNQFAYRKPAAPIKLRDF